MDNSTKKLPFRIEWGFGIANFFMQFVQSISLSYFTFVITDVFMLGTGVAATVNSVSSLTGIVGMFMFAALFQYTNLKWGRYRSWIMILAPLVAVGYIGMYVPWNLPTPIWTVLLCIFFIIGSLAVTGMSTCCNSLVPKCGGDAEGRMRIVGRQNVLHNASRVIGGIIVIPIVTFIGGSETSPIGYMGFFAIFSALVVISYYWLANSVKEYDPYDPNFRATAANKVSIKDMLVALGTNRHLLALFMGKLLSGCLTVHTSLAAYFFTYVCGDLSYYALYNTISPFGGVIGGLLTPWFTARFDKKKLYIATVGFQIFICYPIMTINYFMTGSVNPILAVAMLSLGFLSNNISLTYFNTFYMDCAEYSLNKTGKDITPIIMTLSRLPAQLSRGVGSALGLIILGAVGYQAGQVQTPETTTWIVLLYTLGPTVAQSVMLLFMGFGYKLSTDEVNRLIEENKAKREALKAAK